MHGDTKIGENNFFPYIPHNGPPSKRGSLNAKVSQLIEGKGLAFLIFTLDMV